MEKPKRTYLEQRRKCGKFPAGHCHVCKEQGGHGPYWYAFWRDGGKLKSQYLGKLKDGQTIEQLDEERWKLVTKPVNKKNLAKLADERKAKPAKAKPAAKASKVEVEPVPVDRAEYAAWKAEPAPKPAKVKKAKAAPAPFKLGTSPETATTLASVLAGLPEGTLVGTSAATLTPLHDFTGNHGRAELPEWYSTEAKDGKGMIKLYDPNNPFGFTYTYVLPAEARAL